MLRMRLCPVPATRRRSRGEPRRRRRSRRRPKRRAGKRLGHPSRPPLVLFNLGGHRQARKPTPQPWAGVAPGTRGRRSELLATQPRARAAPTGAAARPRSGGARACPTSPPDPRTGRFFFFFFPAETNRQASSPSLLPPTLFSTLTLLHYTNFIVKLSRVFTGDPRHPPPQLSRGSWEMSFSRDPRSPSGIGSPDRRVVPCVDNLSTLIVPSIPGRKRREGPSPRGPGGGEVS